MKHAPLHICLAALILCTAARAEKTETITFTAAVDRSEGSWVEGTLPAGVPGANELVLTRLDTGAEVPAQRSVVRPNRFFFRLAQKLRAKETRRYRVKGVKRRARVTAAVTKGNLTVKTGGRTILVYNVATDEAPEGAPDIYRRSGYIHPLMTPQGRVLTDDFPPDHLHQHGIFRAWVNTTFRGEKIDFWNQKKLQGDVRHVGEPTVASGSLFAEFKVDQEHFTTTKTQPGTVVIKETWWVICRPSGGCFEIDLESIQRFVTPDPLTVNKYHYGGFAIRGNRNWTPDSGFTFLTSEGKTRVEGNHTRARWVRMQGPVDKETGYSVAMGSPGNFRAPQPVRLHPSMPYYAFAPMVLGEFQLTNRKTHVARFRLVTGDGSVSADTVETWWHDYAHSLKQESRGVGLVLP